MAKDWSKESKFELIMDVWERLDCEDVGREEIEAIRTVLDDIFGLTPKDTPMKIGRILANEGAVLRHAEILELDVEVRVSSDELVDSAFEIDTSSPSAALDSITEMTRRFRHLNAKQASVRALRQNVIETRDLLKQLSTNQQKPGNARRDAAEIAEWLSIWLQSPDMFETWIEAKKRATSGGTS